MIQTLEAKHWDHGVVPDVFDAKHKGRAIDRQLREQVKSTSPLMDPYDWEQEMPEFGLPLVRYHEFKSTSSYTISISRTEIDFAERKYKDGNDVMYWVIWQGSESLTYDISYLIRYSTLHTKDLLHKSQFENGGAFFYAARCEPHGIPF